MKREKSVKLIVVFPTTTDAMHMQQAAGKRKLPGRMIPLPGKLSAGCGLAWCTELTEREAITALTKELGIHTQGFYEQEQ